MGLLAVQFGIIQMPKITTGWNLLLQGWRLHTNGRVRQLTDVTMPLLGLSTVRFTTINSSSVEFKSFSKINFSNTLLCLDWLFF